MLSREVMGLLALAILWVSALLVAGAAWQDLRDVFGLWRRARRALRGTVESAEGDVLASWSVAQRGRALDARHDAIAFHDRAFRSTVGAGSVRIGARAYSVAGPGEVWPSSTARASAAAADPARFDAAHAQATRAGGFEREVTVALRAGDEVFVMGEVSGERLVAPATGQLILSSFDPSGRLARHAWTIVGFIVGELGACALVSRVALASPHFGPSSIFGAVLCLGFYLGVTPLAVALRERVRRPSEAYLRGTWVRGS